MVDKVDFTEVPKDRGYDSAFESDAEAKERRQSYQGLVKEKQQKVKVGHKRELEDELIREEGKIHRYHAVAVDAFSRHKDYINNYLLYYGGSKKDFQRDKSRDKRDIDVIREHHQFLWKEGDDADQTWEKRLAKKYYDKLFKEYCIADLSRYKENKIGMRWRTEQEVIDGKGQFFCGNKKCEEQEGLRSWEVNFGYVEHGEKKNALVKLRLCPDCSYKLNYHHKRKEILPKVKEKSTGAKTDILDKDTRKKQKRSDKDINEPSSSKSRQSPSSEKERKKKESEEDNEDGDEAQTEEGKLWSKPVKLVEEKSREEEFDEYFADMFL